MYQRDFILRMIEMLGELIAGILGKIKKGEYQQASIALENAYYNFLKEDASFFRNLNKEELTEKLLVEHNYTHGHLEMLAELFYAEAELLLAKGNRSGSIAYFEKALLLFEFVSKDSRSFSLDKQSKIQIIMQKIAEANKPSL
ncbi:MAG: hypothetical protein M0P66_03840 [Salinivirgaceae bacterium]|nr:hypothetical protein [Salinivirgaceae bacterium]